MFQELLSMPVVASEHGQDVDNFIIYIHWLMGALFIGWTSYYLYALFAMLLMSQLKCWNWNLRLLCLHFAHYDSVTFLFVPCHEML